ncbi:MAG: hypothetical protein FJX03_05235 [Alphaproteobacteria bacterium]|nr:hypothetical protein [Alphaproteobacteria bacterium]
MRFQNLTFAMILICCVPTYASQEEKAGEGSAQRPVVLSDDGQNVGVSTSHVLKRADTAENITKRKKRSGDELGAVDPQQPEPSLEGLPKKEKVMSAFYRIQTEKFILAPVLSTSDYTMVFNLLFADAKATGVEEVVGLTHSGARHFVENIGPALEYPENVDFGNYCIRSPVDLTTIGIVTFPQFITSPGENAGFLEVRFHLMSQYKGKGIGQEILAKLIPDLFIPKVGKNCLFMRSVHTGLPQTFLGEHHFRSTLKGVFATCNLSRTTYHDTTSLMASYYKAHFGFKLKDGQVIMCYPAESYPPGKPLENKEEVGYLLKIAQAMTTCRDLKTEQRNVQTSSTKSTPIQANIDFQEVLSDPGTYKGFIDKLWEQYKALLKVSEPYTFLSALETLQRNFDMSRSDLDASLSSEKAASMLTAIQAAMNFPPERTAIDSTVLEGGENPKSRLAFLRQFIRK